MTSEIFEPQIKIGALLKITVKDKMRLLDAHIYLYTPLSANMHKNRYADTLLFALLAYHEADAFLLLCTDGNVGILYTQYYDFEEVA